MVVAKTNLVLHLMQVVSALTKVAERNEVNGIFNCNRCGYDEFAE